MKIPKIILIKARRVAILSTLGHTLVVWFEGIFHCLSVWTSFRAKIRKLISGAENTAADTREGGHALVEELTLAPLY